MKKLFITAGFLTLLLPACKKDDSTNTNNGGGNNTTAFTWKEDGGADITADSAFWTTYTGGAGVRAYKGGMANFFEINFANTTVGAQSLKPGLTFLKGSATYTSTSGTVNITDNASNLLSGNLTCTVGGGSIQAISCTWNKLAKR